MLNKLASYGVLLFTPLFFSSNLLFGKAVIPNVEPWTLAFLRWGIVSLVLLPFVAFSLRKNVGRVFTLLPQCGVMGFLGMWICGAVVYFALITTSATNAILIYLSSPVLIILIEGMFYGRRIGVRDVLGIVLGLVGVITILLRGDVATLVDLDLNIGDLAMVFAAIAWAVYSVMFKSDALNGLPSAMLLCLFSGLGALTLLPFMLFEVVFVAPVPVSVDVWASIAGIVAFSSLMAFLGYQHSVRFAGAAIAGIFMYLLPVYGVGLAVLILGESFERFHMIGILTILGGVIIATFPADVLRRRQGMKVAAE